MRNLPLISIIILLLFSIQISAQKTVKKDNFNVIKEEEGDLNHDKKNDRIAVELDITDETRPMRLRIYLSEPKSKNLRLAVSSTKLIESQYPTYKKGEHSDGTIPDFFVEDGNLQMLTDIRGFKSSYTFRFKNNNFELIHISRVIWDGKNTTSETEIDLLKGTKLTFDQELGSDDILNKKQTKLKIVPLRKIQDLSFSDLEKY